MKRRGATVTEVVAASSLALVLLGAAFPSPRAEAAALVDLAEDEAARLLLEGELSIVRQEVARGAHLSGAWRRDPARWRSRTTLPGLELDLRAAPAPDGLVEVTLEARWRGRAPDRQAGPPRRQRLTTLATPGRAP